MNRIAIIRGPNLNPYEMQSYKPLTEGGFNLIGFGGRRVKEKFADFGFPVRRLPILSDFSTLSRYQALLNKFFGDSQVMIGLERNLEGFDIAHSAETFNYYTYQAVRAKLMGKVKKVLVTAWENVPFVGDYNPRQRQLKGLVLQHTDLFHAVTERAKQSLVIDGVPADKIRVIPYGVDLERFRPQVKDEAQLASLGIDKTDLVILSIGRLVWEKGFDHLIFAAKKLLFDSEIPGDKLKFVVVGAGPRQRTLKDQIRRLGLAGQFIMLGSVPYHQIPQIHALADIFVLLSAPIHNWQEQFGMVLVESMASGKPVVAGMSGSIPEVVGDAAILVQPGDFVSIAETLKYLILDEKLRHERGQVALKRARGMFDASKVTEELRGVYVELLTEARRGSA